jgi:hypothetical protein
MAVLSESIRAGTCGSLHISPEEGCAPGVEAPGVRAPEVGNAVRDEAVTAGKKVAGGRPNGVGVGDVFGEAQAASRAAADRNMETSFVFITLLTKYYKRV